MGMAIFWGGLAGFANLLGALIVLRIQLSSKIIGYIMALGTGALIGAVAFELLADALELGSMYDIALGFLGGALIFTVADSIISRRGGKHRKRSSDQGEESSGLAIFIGTIMDAIPETAMIGLSLLSGQVSFALVLAIFISNIPEGLSSTTGLKSNGYSTKKILIMWASVLLMSMMSALAGFTLLGEASGHMQALVNAFAAGGILAMVASTMMPEAYEKGGPIVGFITAVGLFITLLLQ
ncbi:MAG TPA: ZIP family metal transporter [Metalysinibacillus sp.]